MRSGVVFPRSGESNRKQSRCCHILALYNDYSFIINALIRPIFKYQVPHGTYGKSQSLQIETTSRGIYFTITELNDDKS